MRGEETCGRLTTRSYDNILPREGERNTLDGLLYIRMGAHRRKVQFIAAYAGSSCIDLATTLVIGTFLLLDLRPLVPSVRQVDIKDSS